MRFAQTVYKNGGKNHPKKGKNNAYLSAKRVYFYLVLASFKKVKRSNIYIALLEIL